MDQWSCVILAAGKSTRMGTDLPKAAQELLSKPLIRWVYDAAKSAGAGKICAVVGYKPELVKACLPLDGAFFAHQENQLGTGHAVMSAKGFLEETEGETVVVLPADAPFIGPETLRSLITAHIGTKNAVTVLTSELMDPFGYGRIVKDEGRILRIVEQKDASEQERKIREVNSGIYCFRKKALLSSLERLSRNNAQGEYYLTDTVGILSGENERAGAVLIPDPFEARGINSLEELYAAQETAKERIFKKLLSSGVYIMDPHSTFISPDAKVGRGSVLYPSTLICGQSEIGENCIVGPNALVENSTIGDGVRFNASQCYESRIGEGSKIGPFAYLRPKTVVGKHVKVGDFVEIKNARIGDHTKISHLSYMGDCVIGQHSNIGCGAITVNYDGQNKYLTEIGDRSFVGCNANLIAPVKVSSDTYIAAGSTITSEVPEGALAVARARQVNKEGWVIKRRDGVK